MRVEGGKATGVNEDEVRERDQEIKEQNNLYWNQIENMDMSMLSEK